MNRREFLKYVPYIAVPTLLTVGYVVGKKNSKEKEGTSKKHSIFSRKPKDPIEILEDLVTACIEQNSSRFEDLCLTREDCETLKIKYLRLKFPEDASRINSDTIAKARKTDFRASLERTILYNPSFVQRCFPSVDESIEYLKDIVVKDLHLEKMDETDIVLDEMDVLYLAELLKYDSVYHNKKQRPNNDIDNMCRLLAQELDTKQRVNDEPGTYIGPFYFFSDNDITTIKDPEEMQEIIESTIHNLTRFPDKTHNPYIKENSNEANICVVAHKNFDVPPNWISDLVIFLKPKNEWKISQINVR